MTYVVPDDFRERTQQPWTANVLLEPSDASDAILTTLIAQVAADVELELADDFDPPNPDNDETIDVDGQDSPRLYLPRRTRSITTVKSRNSSGVLTTEAASSYRLHSSLTSAGTAILQNRRRDWLDALPGLSTGTWVAGTATVQVTGKFGWAAVPTSIRRLVALRVYDMVKGTADPLSQVVQRSTVDAVITFGEPREADRIVRLYSRKGPVTV